ncbi:MAG: protein O-mannosyl-transferase family [Planctomycetota bacterium]
MPQLAAARIEKRGNILVLLLLLLGILAQWPDELRWGDGLELVAVSSHLGVAHPPGYPLLTLLGRATLFLPGENPYRAMLWISRASVLACALGLYSWLKAVLGLQLSAPGWRCFTAGVVAISFAWGGSLWPALVVVEVYGLNAALLVWVACLLARAPNEGQDIGRRALLLASCLEGLALANHISSLCMLPLLLSSIWRQARATRQLGSATSSAALLLGIPVALYATLLPRAAVEHGIAWGGTRDLRSLLVHLSGGEYGSLKFLMEDLNTPFDLYSWAPFFVKDPARL